MTPYDPACIIACLRTMPPAQLATATPALFQTHPVQVITPWKLIDQYIANERARRA